MSVIPLSTYKRWAEDIKLLEHRFFALIPWINLFPLASTTGKWYYSLMVDNMFAPFAAFRHNIEELSWDQYKAVLEPLCDSERFFFYTDPVVPIVDDAFTIHFKNRAAQVQAVHTGRGKPKPAYSETDLEFLRTHFFAAAETLLADILATVRTTHENHTHKVIADIAVVSQKFAKAKAKVGV